MKLRFFALVALLSFVCIGANAQCKGKCRNGFGTFTFEDGETLNIEDVEFKIILTPGHTDGSACFACGNYLFTGDTLFKGTVGRTDFPTGNREDMIKSVKKLFALDVDFNVYPGHEQFTTLFFEKEHNIFSEFE